MPTWKAAEVGAAPSKITLPSEGAEQMHFFQQSLGGPDTTLGLNREWA